MSAPEQPRTVPHADTDPRSLARSRTQAQPRTLATRDLTSGYHDVPVVRSVNLEIPNYGHATP